MLTRELTYKDYNGVERTEKYYFGLNEAELMKLEFSVNGGLVEMINKIVAAKDGNAIMEMFDKILLMAHGVKSADGKQFIKNDQTRAEFAQSPAYSIIFMELVTDADKAAKFVEEIVPGNVKAKLPADAAVVPIAPLN